MGPFLIFCSIPLTHVSIFVPIPYFSYYFFCKYFFKMLYSIPLIHLLISELLLYYFHYCNFLRIFNFWRLYPYFWYNYSVKTPKHSGYTFLKKTLIINSEIQEALYLISLNRQVYSCQKSWNDLPKISEFPRSWGRIWIQTTTTDYMAFYHFLLIFAFTRCQQNAGLNGFNSARVSINQDASTLISFLILGALIGYKFLQ